MQNIRKSNSYVISTLIMFIGALGFRGSWFGIPEEVKIPLSQEDPKGIQNTKA